MKKTPERPNMQTFLLISVLFSLVFVNGFTDAPNSIASAVGSGAIEFRKAKKIAAVFDFLGVLTFAFLFPAVAKTSKEIADFGSNMQTALSAGMLSAVLFSLAAWFFGIPTSESHGMSAAVSGAAFFSGGNVGTISWIKISAGLFLSSLVSAVISVILLYIFKKKRIMEKTFFKGQIFLSAGSAFLHGAQDGQKFLGLLLIISGNDTPGIAEILSVAATVSVGTFCCTERIVNKVAKETVSPDGKEGFAADISSIFTMFLSTLLGIPVSTSNIKVSTLAAVGGKKTKISSFLSIAAVWILTFPVCFLLGGGIYRLFEFFSNC